MQNLSKNAWTEYIDAEDADVIQETIYKKDGCMNPYDSRRDNDDYPTESAMLAPLLALEQGQMIKGTVLEPAAGAGSLASSLKQAGLRVVTNDIDPQYKTDYNLDATVRENWFKFPRTNWVVTNPPWSSGVLEKFMEYSLGLSSVGVALLLRLSANEPVIKRSDRGEILMSYSDNLRYLQTFSAPRPKFDPTKNGTDSVTSAWFVWQHGWSWKERGIECPFQYVVNWK